MQANNLNMLKLQNMIKALEEKVATLEKAAAKAAKSKKKEEA